MPGAVNLVLRDHAIISKLKSFLISRRTEAYLVGGYIRDALRGAPFKDIDIAVSGDPIPIANELAGELGGTCIILGHTHQIARIIVPVGTRGWTIDLSTLHGSIQDDIASRDFTIDAMALPIGEWGNGGWEQRILDPFSGTEDLRKGIIRAVTPKVFQDDPLRLLRAVRLSASLGFSIEPDTAGQISQRAHLVTTVAGERTRDEFLAILALEGAKTHLEIATPPPNLVNFFSGTR